MQVFVKRYRTKGKWVHVSSLKEASTTVRSYITEHAIGSSTWEGGEVKDDANSIVAKVSYNGRIWDTEWKEIIPQ